MDQEWEKPNPYAEGTRQKTRNKVETEVLGEGIGKLVNVRRTQLLKRDRVLCTELGSD